MMICFVMGFVNLVNFVGFSFLIGLVLVKIGDLFLFVSFVFGWIGVFIIGLVVSNNVLFGYLQVVIGVQIGVGFDLLLVVNMVGGVMVKFVFF